MSPDFTVSRLRSLRTGEMLSTPVNYLIVRKINQWFILENKIMRTKRYYTSCEDIIEMVVRERFAS